MKQNVLSSVLLVALLVTSVGAVVSLVLFKKPAPVAQQPTSVVSVTEPTRSPAPAFAQPTPEPMTSPAFPFQSRVYENAYMKVLLPAGWTTAEAIETVSVGGFPQKRVNPAAANITKNNYILYINTRAQKASGVEGGRFSEIAMGAPSADTVMKVHPSDPCGSSETHLGFAGHPRVDLYVNNQERLSGCVAPSHGSTVWYFSYITNSKSQYFNYYKGEEPLGLVITMAYNTKDVNALPVKGSAELKGMLSEMTAVAKTLEVKKQTLLSLS